MGYNDVGDRRRRTALSVSCPCLVFVRIFRKILSGVCPLSGFCPDFLSGVCLSGFCLSRFCPLSGFCPDFWKTSCPVSVCPGPICLDFVSCLDSVRIFRKNAVRCLSVRIFFVLILPAVCLSGSCLDTDGYCPYGLL